jgi:hypothetical protein
VLIWKKEYSGRKLGDSQNNLLFNNVVNNKAISIQRSYHRRSTWKNMATIENGRDTAAKAKTQTLHQKRTIENYYCYYHLT